VNYQRLYEYRFRGIPQATRTAAWEEIAAHVYRELGSPDRVLDPAAGRGEFVNAVAAGERWAVDAVAYAEGTHAPGVKVVVSDIFAADLPRDYFGGVWVSNFLEHLLTQDAVAEFLEKMRGVLRPGGRIAIMGPNFRYCADEYFDCADHTLIFTHLAIAEHVYAAGFEPLRIVPRFLPYSFRGALPAGRSLVRGYLRTPVVWPLLGKQFLVVAERV
jgi:SAM-dependent methyltransferase